MPSPVPPAAPPQPAPSRRRRQQQQEQQPPKPTGSPFAIRPGRPGDRPPPSEFDGLFRSDDGAAGAGAGSPGETQQLPQFTAPAPADSGGGHGGHGGRGARAGRRRRMSPAVLIGIVIAGCGIAGLAAGAALSAGGDDEKKDDNTTLGSSEPSATEDEPTKKADPAEPQAKALDALLKDSNNSRSAVINAVNNIKSCKALPKAASDLRTAARQRNDLVTRLGKLTVDKLPNQAQLTASLTKAWKSSAQADNQYAAWADQTRGKKGCPKGQARRTGRVGAAERASGEATAAKRKAAELWNPLAGKYGLTKHEATQL
ncbi:putative membrane protein [Streptomyces himastatinicus ATCC 53653]|uniref:Putative membrane protein n=1 Tax=Streptomyces himastatinicus ATCC 53653 TaxID=457427 RepID=D9WEN5_9ACTN|nr:putative membrane protein [Streptomyces himastatinicus ATCC 53653]